MFHYEVLTYSVAPPAFTLLRQSRGTQSMLATFECSLPSAGTRRRHASRSFHVGNVLYIFYARRVKQRRNQLVVTKIILQRQHLRQHYPRVRPDAPEPCCLSTRLLLEHSTLHTLITRVLLDYGTLNTRVGSYSPKYSGYRVYLPTLATRRISLYMVIPCEIDLQKMTGKRYLRNRTPKSVSKYQE